MGLRNEYADAVYDAVNTLNTAIATARENGVVTFGTLVRGTEVEGAKPVLHVQMELAALLDQPVEPDA